jgi:hypothetical protein
MVHYYSQLAIFTKGKLFLRLRTREYNVSNQPQPHQQLDLHKIYAASLPSIRLLDHLWLEFRRDQRL